MSRHEEERQHYYDTCYEVWWSHGNPDSVSADRCEDYYYNGLSPETAALRELERQYPQRDECGGEVHFL